MCSLVLLLIYGGPIGSLMESLDKAGAGACVYMQPLVKRQSQFPSLACTDLANEAYSHSSLSLLALLVFY